MRLEKASKQAIKFACLKFHYAKAVPAVTCAYSVFNDKGEWCGVVCFSGGANRHIASEFGLSQGQVVELVRVALNGKQECTSKVVALSLRLLKKDAPLLKLVVSYADGNQQHTGKIYQATNWYYIGKYAREQGIILNGHKVHRRSINSKYGTSNMEFLKSKVDRNAMVVKGFAKFKYIFPMVDDMKAMCKLRSLPYPKEIVD